MAVTGKGPARGPAEAQATVRHQLALLEQAELQVLYAKMAKRAADAGLLETYEEYRALRQAAKQKHDDLKAQGPSPRR